MNKKLLYSIICVLILLIISIAVCYTLTGISYRAVSENTAFRPTIVIDPGHGGEDSGAISINNMLEKDLNLQIALKLKAFLLSNGFDVKMTRETDIAIYDEEETDNKKRSDLLNRVDIFNASASNIVISIHQNKFTQSQYSGAQIFYSPNNFRSEYLAENIRMSIVSLLQQDNERQCKKAGSEILILNNTEVPCVMVECGFLSNEIEALELSNDSYQYNMAYCICLGFLEYYYTNY